MPGRKRWAMSTRLTLFYTLSVFVLLAATSALLYWEPERDTRRSERELLVHKMQVLAVLLEKQPLDRTGVDQRPRRSPPECRAPLRM